MGHAHFVEHGAFGHEAQLFVKTLGVDLRMQGDAMQLPAAGLVHQGARVAVANATTTDHPLAERVSGNYSVVTVESVFDFLHQRSQLQQELVIPHVPVAGATAASP